MRFKKVTFFQIKSLCFDKIDGDLKGKSKRLSNKIFTTIWLRYSYSATVLKSNFHNPITQCFCSRSNGYGIFYVFISNSHSK